MPEVHRLRLVPTDPGGPEAHGIEVGGGRVCLVRGRLWARRGPCAPLGHLRDVRSGTPAELAGIGWLSPGAQVALQRAQAERPGAMLLLVRLDDGVRDACWLLSGDPGAVAGARAALAGEPGDPGPSRDPVGPPARRPAALAALVALAAAAGLALVVALVFRGAAPGPAEPARPLPARPAPAPSVAQPRPHGVAAVVRAVTSERVRAAGVRFGGPPRVSGGRLVIGLRDRRGRILVIVHATPAAAAAARRAADARAGNVLVRGAAPASRNAIAEAIRTSGS